MIKTAIFIDAGHLHYHLYNKWRIDYKKLIEYFSQKGYLPLYSFYYEGMPTEQSYSSSHPAGSFSDFLAAKKAKKKYFEVLRSFGLTVRSKPVHRFYDKETREYKFKCNSDVELTIDAVETVLTKETEAFIICSGDGDFLKLLKYLKSKSKKVLIAGFKESIHDELFNVAHELVFLEAIKDKIEYC